MVLGNIRVHSVCYHKEISLECILIHAADVINMLHFLGIKYRGGFRIFGKGVHINMYKGVGTRFAGFILFCLISHENEIIWSH